MKKEDQNRLNRIPTFEDADHMQSIREDRLTAMEDINVELQTIAENQKKREAEKAESDRRKAEEDAKAELEAQIRRSIADESKSE